MNIDQQVDYFKTVATYELKQGRGGFLTAFLTAFIRADKENGRLLLEPMRTLAEKYRMKNLAAAQVCRIEGHDPEKGVCLRCGEEMTL